MKALKFRRLIDKVFGSCRMPTQEQVEEWYGHPIYDSSRMIIAVLVAAALVVLLLGVLS